MYIKIKQSIFSSKYGMLDTGREIEVDDVLAKDFINAGFAEQIEPEVKEVKKPARKTAKKETPKQEGEE